jgi:hypothetical protein
VNDERDVEERRRLLLAGAGALVAQWLPGDAPAQDATRTEPGAYRTVFENEFMRVLEFVSRPRTEVCGVGKHSHPAHLTVALSDAKVRVTLPDGKRIEATNKLGDVFWSEAETHVVENIGGNNMRALIIELKNMPARQA